MRKKLQEKEISARGMERKLAEWCAISSASTELNGLFSMADALEEPFSSLGATLTRHVLPSATYVDCDGVSKERSFGPCLQFMQRKEAPIQLLLAGHMDTALSSVRPPRRSGNRLFATGAADMKGGLVAALFALRAFEKSAAAARVGWEFWITPDEEIGSPASAPLLIEAATRCRFGLIFEPALPNGHLVSARKGSANYTIVAKGRAAHAGRDFWEGKNALTALSEWSVEAERLSNQASETTVNIGVLLGGQARNQVADHAVCQLNVRSNQAEELSRVEEELQRLAEKIGKEREVSLTLTCETLRPPKPLDEKTEKLLKLVKECGSELGIPIAWEPSGGVCDGNLLARLGLPTLDTLGVVGGALHTEEEFVELDSLPERAELLALFLERLAE